MTEHLAPRLEFESERWVFGIGLRPSAPWQNGLVERLIGSARREYTDHVIVFNEEHLRRILSKYASYYNEVRTHLSLGKDAPCTRPILGSHRLWVGGMVPLGYKLEDGKLSIVDQEAERVRMIFSQYLALGSVNRLVLELRERNVRTKIRKLSNGSTRGVGVATLRDAPAEWSLQFERLGLAQP